MSTGGWLCLMLLVGLCTFWTGKQIGIRMYEKEASEARAVMRSTLSKITARYVLEKRDKQPAGYYEGCYRTLLFCLSWMEDL